MKWDLGMAWGAKKERNKSHYTAKIHRTTWNYPLFQSQGIEQILYRDGVLCAFAV